MPAAILIFLMFSNLLSLFSLLYSVYLVSQISARVPSCSKFIVFRNEHKLQIVGGEGGLRAAGKQIIEQTILSIILAARKAFYLSNATLTLL
jgi:hypothetical protein